MSDAQCQTYPHVADAELRDALLALIDAERALDPTAGYEQHLRAALVEGGLEHRPGEGMSHGVTDEDDALAHACNLSSSSKKPGYEITALPGREMTVRPAAMRPAIAKVIASR